MKLARCIGSAMPPSKRHLLVIEATYVRKQRVSRFIARVLRSCPTRKIGKVMNGMVETVETSPEYPENPRIPDLSLDFASFVRLRLERFKSFIS